MHSTSSRFLFPTRCPNKSYENLGSTIRFPAGSGEELHAIAYLGFQKGGIFLLGTSAHTKGGKPSFPTFFRCRKYFFAKKAWSNAPSLIRHWLHANAKILRAFRKKNRNIWCYLTQLLLICFVGTLLDRIQPQLSGSGFALYI